MRVAAPSAPPTRPPPSLDFHSSVCVCVCPPPPQPVPPVPRQSPLTPPSLGVTLFLQEMASATDHEQTRAVQKQVGVRVWT